MIIPKAVAASEVLKVHEMISSRISEKLCIDYVDTTLLFRFDIKYDVTIFYNDGSSKNEAQELTSQETFELEMKNGGIKYVRVNTITVTCTNAGTLEIDYL